MPRLRRITFFLGGILTAAFVAWILQHETPQATSETPAPVSGAIQWDIEHANWIEDEEREWFKAAALKVLKDEPRCRRVVTGARGSTSDSSKPYYIACADGDGQEFNVPFDKPDAIVARPLKNPDAYNELSSRSLCEGKIERSVAHPSTLEIKSYVTKVFGNGDRLIWHEFNATNSFGLELKYAALCTVKPNGSADIAIHERR
jgi:hypothetical protein